jgi:membrane-associated phospholipid phosphatase
MTNTSRPLAFILMLLILAPVPGGLLSSPALAAEKEESSPGGLDTAITAGARILVEDAKALVTAPLRMDGADALKAGGALALVGGMFAADKPIRTLVLSNQSSAGRNTADAFNTLGSAGTLFAFNAGVAVVGWVGESYGGSSKLKETGLISFEAEGFAVAATLALKEITGRSRPYKNQGTANFRPFSSDGSFPSTTTAASFAVATVFAERYGAPAGVIGYTLATAVAAARVYSDQHFASDVMAAALIGWGMGYFLSKRHGGEEDPTAWQIRPVAMGQGLGGGVTIGRRF